MIEVPGHSQEELDNIAEKFRLAAKAVEARPSFRARWSGSPGIPETVTFLAISRSGIALDDAPLDLGTTVDWDPQPTTPARRDVRPPDRIAKRNDAAETSLDMIELVESGAFEARFSNVLSSTTESVERGSNLRATGGVERRSEDSPTRASEALRRAPFGPRVPASGPELRPQDCSSAGCGLEPPATRHKLL